MTLKEIFEAGSRFAINEITGEIIRPRDMTSLEPGYDVVFRNKKVDKRVLLAFLFNQEQVDASWSPICRREVMARLDAYQNSESRGDYIIVWKKCW